MRATEEAGFIRPAASGVARVWPRAIQSPSHSAMLPILVSSPGGAAKHPGLDLAWSVPSLRIAAPARRNRPHSPWRSRVVPLVARSSVRRGVSSHSTWTRQTIPPRTPHVPTGVKKQSRVGGLIYRYPRLRGVIGGVVLISAGARGLARFVGVCRGRARRSASVRHGAWTASYGFWTVDNVHDSNGRQC